MQTVLIRQVYGRDLELFMDERDFWAVKNLPFVNLAYRHGRNWFTVKIDPRVELGEAWLEIARVAGKTEKERLEKRG